MMEDLAGLCAADNVSVSEPVVILMVLYSLFGLLYVFCYGATYKHGSDAAKIKPLTRSGTISSGVETRRTYADASDAKRKKIMEMKRLLFHNRKRTDSGEGAEGYETDYNSISFKEQIGNGTYG